MSKRMVALWSVLFLLALPMTATAVPSYQLRTDAAGVPLILTANQGHGGLTMERIDATNDGLVYAYDDAGSGYEYHVMDPALESPNNAATSAEVALVQFWSGGRDMYEASVSTGVTVSAFTPRSGMTSTMANGAFLTMSGGGSGSYGEIRFEDNAGSYDGDSGMGARRGNGSFSFDTARHKSGLEWVAETGPGTDTWQVLVGLSDDGGTGRRPINYGVRKTEWGPLTGLNTGGTPAAGTRTITPGGRLVDAGGSATGLIDGLVPGVADAPHDFAINRRDGNLYFVSYHNDGNLDHVYLSAVSFAFGTLADDSPATYVNLDEDTTDNFLEITYDSGDDDPDLLMPYGLTFSPDGSVLYVVNAAGTSTSSGGDRVFQFDLFEPAQPIPEPGALGLALLGLPLLLRRRKKKGRRTSRKWMSMLGLLAVAFLLAPAAQAVPSYQLRTDAAGVPLILQPGTAGHGSDTAAYVKTTTDGYVYGFDALNYGNEFHTFDPALESPNNAPTSAEVALTQIWDTNRDLYEASVSSGEKAKDGPFDGLTRAMPGTNSFFAWSGGGTASIREFRFEDDTGAFDADSGMAARRATGSTSGGSAGLHKSALELIGPSVGEVDTWNVVGALSNVGSGWLAPINRGVRKQQWGPLTGLVIDPDDHANNTAGTRSVAVGGRLVDATGSDTGLISGLVPGVSDAAYDMAYSVRDGNLYFVSHDTENDKVYLSAVSFEWAPGGDFANDSVATYVNLDPDTAETYLDITYVAAGNPPDGNGQDLLRSYGLGFSPDASRLYVNSGTAHQAHVFQFDLFEPAQPIPEPGALGLALLGLPLLLRRRKKKGRRTSRKWMSMLGLLAVAFLLAPAAQAVPTPSVVYQGSMKMPDASPQEHYVRSVCVLPEGTPRLDGGMTPEPRLLINYGWHQHTLEFGQLPALATTAAEMAAAPTAVQVLPASGGTSVDLPGDHALMAVDSAGNLWDINRTVSGSGGGGMYSDPGVHVVGASTLSGDYDKKESGWPGGWTASGCQRLADGTGGALPTDGTQTGATFLYTRRTHADGEAAYLYDVERQDATTMSSTLLFKRSSQDGTFDGNKYQVGYAQDTSGGEWIVLLHPGKHHDDSFVVEFYDPTASGLDPALAFGYDVGPAIASGAGWRGPETIISHVGVDWTASEFYLLEAGVYGHHSKSARLHVFSLEKEPVPEPAGLGLLGLALLALRRRRR